MKVQQKTTGKAQGKNGVSNGPHSIERFINENHRLLTVISVFGALAAYFSQLSSTSQAAQYGVGGSLILFLIAAGVVLDKIVNQMKKLGEARYNIPVSLRIGYAGLFFAFFGIITTILLLMAEEYPKGSGDLLQAIIMYGSGTAYVAFLSDRVISFRGYSKWQHIVRFSPYVAGIILLLFVTLSWFAEVTVPLTHENPAKELGFIAGFVLSHSILTTALAGPAFIIDLIARYLNRSE